MSRNAAAAIGLAILLRLALFPFAENKHGDAPMRALVAERMVIDPASAAVPRTYCQFGPLHTTLMRPFIALDPVAPRSSRILSLLAGIAVLFPFLAFARRLVGQRGAEVATFILALSPLHLQASTTAASEALYLLLWVCALERLLAALDSRRLRTFAAGGLLASLAAVTRYDAWLALPIAVLAAFVFETRDRRRILPGLAVFSGCAASLPVAWLAWGARVGGDPLFFAHYIMTDHAGLAAEVLGRFGPVLGRARQLGIWTLAFVGAMTLPGALAAGLALARACRRQAGRAEAGLTAARLSPAMRIVVVAALGPPALYLARGLLFQSFEPLARFAVVPGVLLLPLAAAAVPPVFARRFLVATASAAVAFSIVVWLVAAVGRERIWAGAESMGALTRLDGEDRALAAWLRANRRPHQPVMIEPLAFADIGIAHAAGVPWTEAITLIVTREPRATVADSLSATGARFLVGYDRSDGTGWPQRLPDWPKPDGPKPKDDSPDRNNGRADVGGTRFGRWRALRR
jgi:4-amino-4-deoxy-L-arabinose transferase-like glycosyltransferase